MNEVIKDNPFVSGFVAGMLVIFVPALILLAGQNPLQLPAEPTPTQVDIQAQREIFGRCVKDSDGSKAAIIECKFAAKNL